jgi:hypothetical protein
MTLLRGRHAPLLAVLAPAVALFLPALGHAAPSADPALTAALDASSKKLEAERETRNLPSLSVAVVHGHDIGHSGAIVGYLASVGALPDLKLGVAVMTNAWNPVLGSTPFDPAGVDPSRYFGHYTLPGGFTHVDVEGRNGKLWLAIREGEGSGSVCEPTGPDRFSCGVEFRMGPDGRATGLSMALIDFRREQESHAQ